MTALLKIVAWRHVKTRPTGDRSEGAGRFVRVCGTLHSHVDDQGASAPSKE